MIDKKQLYEWCRIQTDELENHPNLKIPFRLVETSLDMGELMAREFVNEIKLAAKEGREFRVIAPCGPKAWYAPYVRMINEEKVNQKHVTIFHMDECLNWEGKELAKNDPYNFRTEMETFFYDPVEEKYAVPMDNRMFINASNIEYIREKIWEAPLDYTMGGWGSDGHVAYNQTRRHPFSGLTIEELRNCSIRIQDNNLDTIMMLAHRTFGAAYQFVPPMSVTLGMKECLSAKKLRFFSDTGAWKQTALRVTLFSEPDVEYPMTLVQDHKDVIITATRDTATHPISINPQWEFKGVNT